MAMGYAESVRNARLNSITDLIDVAAQPGIIKIYDGTRPATGGAITTQTLLGACVLSKPSFPAASGGTMSSNAIDDDVAADATGTATWFRVSNGNDDFIMDGNVGTSGADLNMNTTSFVVGSTVSITQWDLTTGNA